MTHSRVVEWSKKLGVMHDDRDSGESSNEDDEMP
jgi:hypothetical protein